MERGLIHPFNPQNTGAGAPVPILQMRNLKSKDVGQDPPNQEARKRQSWII